MARYELIDEPITRQPASRFALVEKPSSDWRERERQKVLKRYVSGEALSPSAANALGVAVDWAMGHDPNASLPRTLATAAGATLGGIGGGLLGAPTVVGTVPGAIAGAGTGAGLVEAALEALTGEDMSLSRVAKQAVGGATGEAVGAPIAKAAAPFLKRTAMMGPHWIKQLAEKHGIPLRASEILDSAGLSKLEKIPSYFLTGAGTVKKYIERQLESAEKAVQDLMGRAERAAGHTGERPDLITAGSVSQKGVEAGFESWKTAKRGAYQAAEAAVGDAHVIDLRGALEHITDLAREKMPIVVPAGLRRIQPQHALEQFKDLPNVQEALQGYVQGRVSLENMPPVIRQFIEQAVTGDTKVSLKTALRMQRELNELGGWGGALATPTIQQGMYRQVGHRVGSAIETFMTSTEGSQAAPLLQRAKELYIRGNELFEQRWLQGLLTKDPEQVIKTAIAPGQMSRMVEFREAVTPEAWTAARTAWLAGLMDRSTTDGVFRPNVFIRELAPYLKSGQMTEMFGAPIAREFQEVATILSKARDAAKLAENPSGTAQGLLSVMQAGGVMRGIIRGSAKEVAELVGAPWMLAKATTSNPGIKLLLEGIPDKFSRPALKFATQTVLRVAGGSESSD